MTEKHPGQLDRCLWSSLGPQHFLGNGKCRYKNFAFRQAKGNASEVQHLRYFEGLNEAGNEMVVIILESE